MASIKRSAWTALCYPTQMMTATTSVLWWRSAACLSVPRPALRRNGPQCRLDVGRCIVRHDALAAVDQVKKAPSVVFRKPFHIQIAVLGICVALKHVPSASIADLVPLLDRCAVFFAGTLDKLSRERGKPAAIGAGHLNLCLYLYDLILYLFFPHFCFRIRSCSAWVAQA